MQRKREDENLKVRDPKLYHNYYYKNLLYIGCSGIEADKVDRFNRLEELDNDPVNSSKVDVENSNKKLSKDEETGKCGDQSQDKDSMKSSASKGLRKSK